MLKRITLIGVCLLAQSVSAAPVYSVRLNNLDLTGGASPSFNDSGSVGASVAAYVQGPSSGISAFATANASGTFIGLTGETTTNSNITNSAGGHTSGVIGIGDIIFTDTTNPGNLGSINVSVNMLSSLNSTVTGTHFAPFSGTTIFTSTEFGGRVGLTGFSPSVPTGNLFSNTLTGSNFTTSTISVDLNTLYSLSFSSNLEFKSNINTNAFFQASMGLGAIPFNLQPGFTVNSVEAGIVNNTIASVVPLPAAAWLFGSGLIGLLGMVRRKRA